MPFRRRRIPIPKKFKNGNEKRCQTMIKRGSAKPGRWGQCIRTVAVASNKRKYCEIHNGTLLRIR